MASREHTRAIRVWGAATTLADTVDAWRREHHHDARTTLFTLIGCQHDVVRRMLGKDPAGGHVDGLDRILTVVQRFFDLTDVELVQALATVEDGLIRGLVDDERAPSTTTGNATTGNVAG